MYCVQYLRGKWFAFKITFYVLSTNVYATILVREPRGWKSNGPQLIEGALLPRGGHD